MPDKIMTYKISGEDIKQNQSFTVEEVLKYRLNLTGREISRIKFANDGILLKVAGLESFHKVRITEKLHEGDFLKRLFFVQICAERRQVTVD